MGLLLKVECYAGYKADERPLRFTFVPSSVAPDHSSRPEVRVYQVTEMVDRWYGPGHECFKVLAHDQNLYVLRHHLGQDNWTLDSFRREGVIED
ncbi:MAG TPA: hypothetical protein VI455_15125 [Terriglobia bacterium]